MSGTEYPKIDTLYDRDERHRVIIGNLRRPEFGIIKKWSVTEKLNGRNTRVSLFDDGLDGIVDYGGRTDEADMPPELLEYLKKTFTLEKMKAAFWIDPLKIPQSVTIYGEGYGHGTGVSGSGVYRKDISFRIFDCTVEKWWLERPNLEDVAKKLEIKCVPILGVIDFLPTEEGHIERLFLDNMNNLVAVEDSEGSKNTDLRNIRPEGIVAKSDPMLFNRKGQRVMWKLKIKDFKK